MPIYIRLSDDPRNRIARRSWGQALIEGLESMPLFAWLLAPQDRRVGSPRKSEAQGGDSPPQTA